jgi:hypothetical protein
LPSSPTSFSPEVQAAETALFSSIYMDEDIDDEDICGVFCACDLCMECYLESDESESQASELTADFDQASDEEDSDREELTADFDEASDEEVSDVSTLSSSCSRSVSWSSTDTLSLCRS